MARFSIVLTFEKRFLLRRFYSVQYEIPERYRNSIYLANAAFYDSVNWFLHSTYEKYYPHLVKQLNDQNLELSEATRRIDCFINDLEQCNSIIDVRFPIKFENGSREIIRGFRAHHGLTSGNKPCLGGLRIDQNITRDHMKALSVLSTYKLSCMGIQLSGAFGGIKINPKNYTDIELKMIIQEYAKQIKGRGYCDGINDIIEPDLNTSTQEMSWIAEIEKCPSSTSVVGKSWQLGGIRHAENSASTGIFFAIDYFLNNKQIANAIQIETGIRHKTIIIQGLNRITIPLVRFLTNCGAVLVGIKEPDASLYIVTGIDLREVTSYKEAKGTIEGFDRTKPVENNDIYKERCDILIFGAHANSLPYHMAGDVQAKVIVEAANGPIFPIAHRTLVARSRLIIPDIYVNTGASVVSYLEFLLNMKELKKVHVGLSGGIYKNILDTLEISENTRQIVLSSTTKKIVDCAMDHDVITYAIEHAMVERAEEILSAAKTFNLGLDLRSAAYIIAIQNLFKSVNDRNNDA